MPVRGCSTVLRRFCGPQADELAILCRPEGASPHALLQAEAAYRSLSDILRLQGASVRDLASETLYLRDIRRDLSAVLEVRADVLASRCASAGALPPTFIQQAPLDDGATFELTASAMVPYDRAAHSVRDVAAVLPCTCEGCRVCAARLIHIG